MCQSVFLVTRDGKVAHTEGECWPVTPSAVVEMFYSCTTHCGSCQLHVHTEHSKYS